MKFPNSLLGKLQQREQNNALRCLVTNNDLVDFSSNDYLGFSKSEKLFHATHQFLIDEDFRINGATGSRLISGNHGIYSLTEKFIATFHQAESSLIFNSGYDANVGFFSCVPQRNDVILFDELCHASIRDGMQMSPAKSYKFQHNDYEDLERLLQRFQSVITDGNQIYIVTESVFSMDGDSPILEEITKLAETYKALLVVDEAHALGVFGDKGEGLVQALHLQDKVFARIMTFGKALGCHGACILGGKLLTTYLVNFARSFIYTTGLSPHAVASVLMAYTEMATDVKPLTALRENIHFFNQEKILLGLQPLFVRSKSAIQAAIIPTNGQVKKIASEMQLQGFNVKAILSPTVPEGQERLRICLHNYNSKEEITTILASLSKLIF